MSLTSTSTDAEVRAAYDDNASYDLNGSAAQCKLFIAACRILLRREPTSAGRNGSAFTLDKQSVREALKDAQDWFAANSDTSSTANAGSVKHLSFGGFR